MEDRSVYDGAKVRIRISASLQTYGQGVQLGTRSVVLERRVDRARPCSG
jgi:hypothetical protein